MNSQKFHVRPNSRYFTSDFPELSSISDSTIAYIQVRKIDGTRATVSPRGRIGWIRKLEEFSGEELLHPLDSFEPKKRDEFEIALGMASWVSDPHSELAVNRIITEIHHHENAFGVTPNETLYSKTVDSLPKGLEIHFTQKESEIGLKSDRLFDYIWRSLNDFLNVKNLAIGKHRIYYNDLPIDMELDFVFGQTLVVALHGRKAPAVKLPYLSGSGILEGLQTSRLSISDPSLYIDEELSIAWYAGNEKQQDLQQVLAEISKLVAQKVEAPRTVFFGGSAGGFASIELCHRVPDSVALVWNAQTDFTRYYRRFYDEYLKSCWSGDESSIPTSVTTSVSELFEDSDVAGSTILYVQQATDNHHTEVHLAPFLQATRGKGTTFLLQRDWSPGHTPPPKQVLKDAIVIASHPQVHSAATKYGFEVI